MINEPNFNFMESDINRFNKIFNVHRGGPWKETAQQVEAKDLRLKLDRIDFNKINSRKLFDSLLLFAISLFILIGILKKIDD